MDRKSDSEKGADDNKHSPAYDDSQYHFVEHDLDRVQRRLKQRHIQMFVPLATCLAYLTVSLPGLR